VEKISNDIQAILANKEFTRIEPDVARIRAMSGRSDDLAKRITEDCRACCTGISGRGDQARVGNAGTSRKRVMISAQNSTTDAKSPSYPEGERAIRTDLAACYRLAAHFRMTDITYTHISARLEGEERSC
jgi:hypothetical protein